MARPEALRVEELRAIVEGRDGLNGQALLDSFGGLEALAVKISSNLQEGLDEPAVARNKVSEFVFVAARVLTAIGCVWRQHLPAASIEELFRVTARSNPCAFAYRK